MSYPTTLSSNLLSVKCLSTEARFSFHNLRYAEAYPLNQREIPYELIQIYESQHRQVPDFMYTSFSVDAHADHTLTVNIQKNPNLKKKYIHWLFQNFFHEQKVIMMEGFVGELLLFLPTNENTNDYSFFDSFRLKVSRNDWSDDVMIMVTYTGMTTLLNTSKLYLEETLTNLVSRWLYRGKIYKNKSLPEEARYHQEEVFPVVSNKMKSELSMSRKVSRNVNIYKMQYNRITSFAKEWLMHPALLRQVNLQSESWVEVPVGNLFQVSYKSNNLLLGNPLVQTVISPKGVLGYHGPFSLPKHKQVVFFAIFQENDKDMANELFKALNNIYGKDKNNKWIQGNDKSLYDYIRLRFEPDSVLSMRFKNLETLPDDLLIHLQKNPFDHANKRYVGIYVSPIPNTSTSEKERMLYFRLKELLLKFQISLQVIDRDKIGKPDFRKYYIHNLAPAMLAKAGGIPWQLQHAYPGELIVGVGAFRNDSNGLQYIGSAFSFNSNGTMRQFNCISKNELFVLAGDIKEFIRQHIKAFGNPERLVIHYYKTMSNKELKPITRMLHELNLDGMPVFIISINKTLADDYILFDHSHPELIPKSGTIAQLSTNQYLLFNNTRYGNNSDKIESFYYPLHLKISCTQPKLLNKNETVKVLIDQVYQFSRVYWKSVKQQNLPVTVSYPAMLAELYSHFKDEHLNEYARTNLWFL